MKEEAYKVRAMSSLETNQSSMPEGRDSTETSKRDLLLVGITFVDVLFALVVQRVLDDAAGASSVPAVAISHYVVAVVVTVFSWIGYHNSTYRPQHRIRFVNLPLLQFTIDIVLVGIYYYLAATAEAVSNQGIPLGKVADARPETGAVLAAFMLYVAWDELGRRINNGSLRPSSTERDLRIYRRHVTRYFALLSLSLTIATFANSPMPGAAVIVVDYSLVLVLFAYRYFKDNHADDVLSSALQAVARLIGFIIGFISRTI